MSTTFPTVVVGDDGSRGARAAHALAEQLAGPGARIIASHVSGPVAKGLLEVAAEEYASLIAVGSPTDERGRLLPRTVADTLLRVAPCPVLIVPEDLPPAIRTIGVAYDTHPESRRALAAAELLAERLDAALIIMRAADEDLAGVALALRRTAARSRARGLHAGGQLLTGAPGPSLAAAARHVDLLVLGSRGQGPLRSAALGSVSHELIADARGPVLVTPRSSLTHPLPVPA